MGKIGFTGDLDDGQVVNAANAPEDHAVYNTQVGTVTERFGQLTSSDLDRKIVLEYSDGTGEIVKLVKVEHYIKRTVPNQRGGRLDNEFAEGTRLTRVVVTRNGDTRPLLFKSDERVSFK